MHPLAILVIGIATIITLIVVFRVHAFVSLIISAILVSCLAPGDVSMKVSRVAEQFGNTAGKIGIVIALASIIGACMMESGAADRIVRASLRLLGEKRAPVALAGSGYVLAMPVFFDTVFFLLVPLARSLFQRTGKNYLLYLLAISAGGAITHTLVPPTPGPLTVTATLNVDLGIMILAGMAVAVPACVAGLAFAAVMNKRMPIPMREIPGVPTPEPMLDSQLPPLWLSVVPVLLPVTLIAGRTVLEALAKENLLNDTIAEYVLPFAKLIGDPNFALLLSTVVAVYIFVRQAARDQIASWRDDGNLAHERGGHHPHHRSGRGVRRDVKGHRHWSNDSVEFHGRSRIWVDVPRPRLCGRVHSEDGARIEHGGDDYFVCDACGHARRRHGIGGSGRGHARLPPRCIWRSPSGPGRWSVRG